MELLSVLNVILLAMLAPIQLHTAHRALVIEPLSITNAFFVIVHVKPVQESFLPNVIHVGMDII